MSRRGSFAALAVSVALVVGAVLALVGGVAVGAWQPAGPVQATPIPGGGIPGAVEYGEFLDDVRAGTVHDAFQDGDILQVNATRGSYEVQLPPGDPDVFGDMEAAAAAGGVPMPGFGSTTGPEETPEPLSYDEFLDQVGSGRIYGVVHTGDRLEVEAVDGIKIVIVPAGADVLDDIEAAADGGEVTAPPYTKVPG